MLKKEYIKLKPNSNNETHLEISMSYTLGGTNWFSGGTIDRGYYLHCSPVQVNEREYHGQKYDMVSSTFGRGLKKCLKTVARQSKKAEAEAEQLAAEYKQTLINAVCREYGLEVDC